MNQQTAIFLAGEVVGWVIFIAGLVAGYFVGQIVGRNEEHEKRKRK